MRVKEPTPDYVRRRLPKSAKEDVLFDADSALRPLFTMWPANRDRGQVLAKVTLLNALYSTRIWNVYPVVNHILKLRIDKRLAAGDLSLVPEIASMRVGEKRQFRLSFASKYCAWHQPEKFQIFDNLVAWMLCEYRRVFGFTEVKWEQLRDYDYFMRVIDAFRARFGLQSFTRKQLDKFLWMEASRVLEARRR